MLFVFTSPSVRVHELDDLTSPVTSSGYDLERENPTSPAPPFPVEGSCGDRQLACQVPLSCMKVPVRPTLKSCSFVIRRHHERISSVTSDVVLL